MKIFNSEYNGLVNKEFNKRFKNVDLAIHADLRRAYELIYELQELEKKFKEVRP